MKKISALFLLLGLGCMLHAGTEVYQYWYTNVSTVAITGPVSTWQQVTPTAWLGRGTPYSGFEYSVSSPITNAGPVTFAVGPSYPLVELGTLSAGDFFPLRGSFPSNWYVWAKSGTITATTLNVTAFWQVK